MHWVFGIQSELLTCQCWMQRRPKQETFGRAQERGVRERMERQHRMPRHLRNDLGARNVCRRGEGC